MKDLSALIYDIAVGHNRMFQNGYHAGFTEGVTKIRNATKQIEINDGYVDIDNKGVVFHDDEKEESWEYTWQELFDMIKN